MSRAEFHQSLTPVTPQLQLLEGVQYCGATPTLIVTARCPWDDYLLARLSAIPLVYYLLTLSEVATLPNSHTLRHRSVLPRHHPFHFRIRTT